jgi:hypothetical protein
MGGSWPATLTAGILLLSKARSFGQPLRVSILRPANEIAIEGPVLLRSNLLVGVGLPTAKGNGNVVLFPGEAKNPLSVRLEHEGWLRLDRSGAGEMEETKAFVKLSRKRERPLSSLAFQAITGLRKLGVTPEPGIIDILFHRELDPMRRLILFLHFGRYLSGSEGQAIQRYLQLPIEPTQEELRVLKPGLRRELTKWLEEVEVAFEGSRALSDGVRRFAEDLAESDQLGFFPPLSMEDVSLICTLSEGLSAISKGSNALDFMKDRFTFLGGTIVEKAQNVIAISDVLPPEAHLPSWDWLLSEAEKGSDRTEQIWRQIMDQLQ